jgi:hypothetical protein
MFHVFDGDKNKTPLYFVIAPAQTTKEQFWGDGGIKGFHYCVASFPIQKGGNESRAKLLCELMLNVLNKQAELTPEISEDMMSKASISLERDSLVKKANAL